MNSQQFDWLNNKFKRNNADEFKFYNNKYVNYPCNNIVVLCNGIIRFKMQKRS